MLRIDSRKQWQCDESTRTSFMHTNDVPLCRKNPRFSAAFAIGKVVAT
jgi:hypothetical protein